MFEREPGINPQQALWQNVLLRTVEDALIGVAQESNRETRIHLCKHARHYLIRPSQDLSTVCNLSGLDMEALIERMRNLIANAPTPEELADNPRKSAATFTKAPAKPKPKPTPFRDQEFTINGVTRTAAEWCLRTGVSIATASQRIGKGLGAELSFTMTKAEAQANSRARYQITTKIAEVRQADRKERRKRRKPPVAPILYECNGMNLPLAEWAERTGINKVTLYKRITKQGMSFEQAITTPVSRRKQAA